jgi:2-oxoglutarate dehydrogenase E1 component
MTQDFGVNQALVEELYLRWCDNPHSVEESWRRFFEGFAAEQGIPLAASSGGTLTAPPTARSAMASALAPAARPAAPNGNGNGHHLAVTVVPADLPPSAEHVPGFTGERLISIAPPEHTAVGVSDAAIYQGRVAALINAYRVRGHLFAKIDPLELLEPPPFELDLAKFGLAQVDPETVFSTGDMAGPTQASLREIVRRLQETYCRTIGVEFTQLDDPRERLWLQERMESTLNRAELSREEQVRVLTKLTDAEVFETFIHTNYIGKKRFSVEGGESVIPMLDLLVEYGGRLGVREIVMGMAHRGRLNVLVNILEKDPKEIFAGFDDKHPELNLGRGDVKYHLGYSSDRVVSTGEKVHLTLAFNPSHLEFVNAIIEGRARAKQDRAGDVVTRRTVLPLAIHGDAAFIGQGIVPEVLNLSLLKGYHTGGTIHVVINNQIGFTTATDDARSCRYATDIARMLRCPVFHVNGEDPEAVVQVARLATEYRQAYGKDVVIDLLCYRKYGHNEADEPRFTKPAMYAAIDKKPTIRKLYVERLVAMGAIDEATAERIAAERKDFYERALREARDTNVRPQVHAGGGVWTGYVGGPDADVPEVDTRVGEDKLRWLIERLTTLPDGFAPHPKVISNVLEPFKKAARGARFPWAVGEALAFASLVEAGTHLRLTGQDSRRGTFNTRHAVFFDNATGRTYCPLAHLAPKQGRVDIWDSPLSEQGVLGFEYGYSLDSPDALVVWEAQFGDFANGAQVIIDQFIVSGEDKWSRLSGLVLMLPHGFEGQGPEHSSARLERFMTLAAEDNIQIQNLTTPAQLFHSLRRQVLRPWRKPLVLMTPKSMLRLPEAQSTLADLANGEFQRVIGDTSGTDPKKVRRVLLCSGKIYYQLDAVRKERGAEDVHIVRLEQLYPLRAEHVEPHLERYGKKTDFVWVQEEPRNSGAWYPLNARQAELFGGRTLRCVSRPESASPATGSEASHKLEQAQLLEAAFAER